MDTRQKHNALRNVIRNMTICQNKLKQIDENIANEKDKSNLSKLSIDRREKRKEYDRLLISHFAISNLTMDKKSPIRYTRSDYPGGSKKRHTKKRYSHRKRSSTITRYPG